MSLRSTRMRYLVVFVPEDCGIRKSGNPKQSCQGKRKKKTEANSTWGPAGANFEISALYSNFEAFQARRCPQRCSLSFLSTATVVVVAAKEVLSAAEWWQTPNSSRVLESRSDHFPLLERLEAASSSTVSYHDFFQRGDLASHYPNFFPDDYDPLDDPFRR
jgi:hypothetical protein